MYHSQCLYNTFSMQIYDVKLLHNTIAKITWTISCVYVIYT